MSQDIGFDVISDLNLTPNESSKFNWEGKATSLYCIVAGNISSDLKILMQTLIHLSRFYQGIFFIPGTLEYETATKISDRTSELITITSHIPKIGMLYQNIVIIDGVAIIGINGWNNTINDDLTVNNLMPVSARHEDINYLHAAIEKIQRHLDVRNIIVVSNAVPDPSLYFGEEPNITHTQSVLQIAIHSDTEHKIKHWVFGSYGKYVDTLSNYTTFIHNPYIRNTPYYAARIAVKS